MNTNITNKPKQLTLSQAYRYKFELQDRELDGWRYEIVNSNAPWLYNIQVFDNEGHSTWLWSEPNREES